MDDNIKKLHQALIDDGYDDVGTEQEFRDYVSDSKNVATLYNALSEAGYDNFKDQKSLETYLSGKAPVAQKPSTPQSSGQSASVENKPKVAQPAAKPVAEKPKEDNRSWFTKWMTGSLPEEEKPETTDKEPGLIAKALGMIPTGVQTSNGTYQPSPEIPQPVVKGEEMPVKEEASSSSSANTAPVTTPTGVVNNEGLMDAKLANYIENWKQRPDKEGDYFANMVADLLADGTANSNEEAVNMVMPALHRYANRSAMDVTNQVVSSLPDDTVQDAEQSIEAQWYSHGVQDKLKQEADSMGISYDDYVAHFLKPAMVQSLVNKYGPNYRNIAEGIATRLYAHDEHVQDRLMNQDINDALSNVINKYVNPSVVDEYNKAQEAGSKAFTEGMEGSQFIPANLRLGTALGAQYEANEAKDPAKVLSGLQQKFGKLYRNPKFLNDMSNAAFKVMQRYGLNGNLSGNPKQFKPMINAAIKNELDQLEIKGMMPKGSAEYIMKTGLGNTIVGKIIRKAVQTDYQNWLEDIANQQYQPGFWENVASGALTFAGDAWSYWLPGAAGGKLTKSMIAKAEGKLAGDLMAKGMERKMAERAAKVLIGKSKAEALKSGAVHGAVTFGGQSAISKPIDEKYRTGQFDENGKIYNPSGWKIALDTLLEGGKQSALGVFMQGNTIANMIGKGRGLATNILADVGGKVVDSGIMTGQQLLERMAHDPNFKPTGKEAVETFLESGANLLSIGFPGFVGKYARFKDAKEFNKKFDFTDQDIAELKRFGYDGLRDAFEKVGIGEYAVVGENAQRLDGQLTQKYMDLMNDKSVPEVLKAKMMAVVEGKRPSSFSPVVDSVIVQPMDNGGKVYLETLNKDGGIIDRKEFSSLDEAQKADKKLEYEKTLGLASVLEGEFHNEFTQEHLEGLYNKAAQKYNMGEKLTDEDKAAVYLHQNAGAIKEIMDKQQKGIILTDEEQKQINAYRHYYDSALENSSVMREFVNTFEDSNGVARGTLRKALESKDKKYAPLVESYLKELYNSIELKREMKQTMDDLYNTSHGNEQKRIEGGNPVSPVEGSAGGQEPPVSEGPASYQDRTKSVPTPSDAEVAANPANVSNSSAEGASPETKVAGSDAFVMGQNAYKNGDSEALQAIDYNSDLATGRLKRAFADNEKMPDIVANAYNEGRDMEQFVAQRASSLTPAQKEAISKYVEAMDAKKGAIDALQHADDGYGEALKEQLWPYQTEDGNIMPATLDSGKQVFLKKANEYGGAFVVVPDEQGQPTIKQVSNAEIREVGTPVPLDEYIESSLAQQKDARNKQFISQFDGSGLKPNDQVTIAMEEGDANINMTFAGYSEDGKIVLTDGKDYLPLSKEEFAAWRKNALDNTINEHLDREDGEREIAELKQAEADKKERFAKGIVGLSEGHPDYSSKDTDAKVAAEYLQEQYGEDHGKLLNLVNGSRDDIKTQLANKRKAAAEYQNWLDTNADLDPEKAKKVEDELSLVNEQIADLDARFKNWNTIRNSVMTPDEVKAMTEERKAEVEKAGVDETAIVPSDDFHVLVLDDKELKKQYPTMDEATDYITSQRKDIYHTQEDVERKINGVNDMLDQYINGETELEPNQLMELNTTKAQLEALQTNLSVAAKGLKAQANKLSKLYKTEVSQQEMEELGMTPSEQRKVLVSDAIKKNDLGAIIKIYKDASVDVTDFTPQTLEEAVSEFLSPHSLNPESLQYELGKSNFKFGIGKGYDSNKFNYLIAKKGTGMSVNEFAVKVYNDLPVNLQDMGYTDQDVRNTLLDMFKSYDSVKEMKNVALMNRIAAAEDELASEEEYYEAQKEREIIERQAEIEKYKSYIHEKELSLPSESELDHINGLEFDRMMEIEDREREYKQYVKSILPELADYDDRSNEEGYGGGSSLGSDSSRRGVDEGNSQGEEVGNGEASSESEIGEGSDSGRKGRQETGSMEPGEGSAVRGSHLPQEASFGERLKSAIAETETEPTEAQKKAGNYKKGHLSFGGYDYTVETPKGVTRSGKDEQGKPWSVTMHDTYGYILGKIGVDGDHIDMFINDSADLDTFDGNVYVVDQVNPETGEFDEHKVMYGYPSEEAATEAYLANYSKGWKGLGNVTSVPKATFDKWLESSDRKTKPFADYAMVQKEQAKFDRDVKEVKPSEMTEAQKVAYGAVSTMLKKAGIPVKVVSNEDMEKVAEAQDNLNLAMLLNQPEMRFKIKTPEEKQAAENAYNFAKELRPDKWKQYAVVDMSNPNMMPEYFEKQELARKERSYYNKLMWGNYKVFNLDKSFEDNVAGLTGSFPSEFDPYKIDEQTNKRNELKKQMKETEEAYKSIGQERKEYQNQLMKEYMDEHGLDSENDIPDDVWNDCRNKSFEKYQDKLDSLFAKYKDLDRQLKAVAEPGVRFLRTYHGSQASFDKFDHSFMGSGEGAQAYGWGTYVSEVEGIAKAYAKQNAKKNAPSNLMYQGKPMTYKTPSIIYQVAFNMDKFNISAKEAISKMIDAVEKKLASVSDTPFAKMKAKQDKDELKVLKGLNPSDFKINDDYDTVAQNLTDTKSGLDLLEDELKDAKSYVDLYQSRLDEAKEELSKAKESGTGLGVDMYESDVMYYSEQVEKYKQNVKTKESDIKDVKTKIDALQKKLDSMEKPRNLYSVDIPDDTGDNYIGWDDPLNAKQIGMWKKALLSVVPESDRAYYEEWADGMLENRKKENNPLTGKDAYYAIDSKYASKKTSMALSKAGFVGVKVIAQRNAGGNKDGKMNYVIFDENNAQIVDHTKFAQGKGVVYGYTDGKEIVLNQEHLNPNTPIHEYQHLWRTAAKEMNPDLIAHGDELIKQTQLFADLKEDPNYKHLSDDEICDEAFARLTGEDGAAILEQMAKDAIKENPLDTAKELTIINRLKNWLKKFWYWTLDTFTKWKPEDIKRMTLEDIRNLVLRDLANGVDPRNVKSRMTKEDAVSLRKQMADNAEQERILEHTEENWLKEFGKDSRVTTPIGSIKLGENQYKKAGRNDRIKRFGLLKPTLERPDVILEKSAPKEGAERQTKYLFIKSFKKADGNKILNYESITVKQGEEEVAISAHQIDPSKVVKELTESKVLWNRFRGDSNSLGENQGSALTPSANNPSGKDSVLNPHSDAKIRNNIETAKGNGGNLSVEDKIKAVSQQFGVDEADVAMYANAIKKGSTAEAARARANIKRHLLQANEDKISSFKELLKYTKPVNEALKENFGDVDAMIEERKQQVEAQRNAMEAARKRAEEEEAKRQKHLEELSVIPDDQLDKQYMDALAKGDDATAREMLDEAARRKGYDDTESAYQGVGAWAAPGNPGYESDKARRDDWESSGSDVNLEDMALGYTPQPDDYFSHPERYSQNTPHGLESVKAINEAIKAIKNGEKDVKVKVYRAVPTSVKEGKLRNGDWVTPSKKYADIHGNNRLEGKYRIIEDEVPANQLWWDGNDANEFGFDDGKEYKYKNAKNNRKLNDLVTYDDKGDVIPPSKRFNSRKNDIRFMFAGEKGAAEADKAEEKTYRMDNLKVAEEMERGKKDAKAIKLATGWERGADGKWRYEMPDAKIKDMKDIGGGNIVKRFEDDMLWNDGKLTDVIDAPGLFEAYPQLKDVRIDTDAIMNDMPSNGVYNAKTNTITIHADELKYMNSILNHEIQHAIQYIEGFGKGGSPEQMEKEFKEAQDEWKARAYAHELEEKAKEMGGEYNQSEVEKALVEEYKDLDMSDELPDKETRIKGFNYFARGYADRSMDDAIKRFRLNESTRSDFDSYKEYLKLAGEVESRNVQNRLGMTDEERRNSLAEETEDVNRDEQIVMNGNDASYSIVKDPETIKKLDKEDTVKVYRAMQVGEDGKLYPPMAAKVKGKFVEPIELGKWEQADERPELADDKGMFTLNKGNGKSLKAAYNPYLHTSRTPLNDQFSEAQNRPNIVTVEVEVPKSELTSGYKADKAKDAVGEVEWKAGIIQGQLTGKRKVVLSRWDKPVRIVPDSEVADVIVNDMFKGKNITMPSNVVTPSLRKELEKRGVPFVETDNRGRIVGGENDGVHYSKVYGKNAQSPIVEQKLKKHPDSLMKAGTYFSGGGLVEEGLKGIIDPVVAVEYDRKISGVYRNNFGQHIVTADVRDVDPKELVKHIDGEVEYFHASPVCKNYSQAKSNSGEVELDKETAKSTADFIDAVKPRVVTIENVKGYKDSEAMKIITQALDKNGYTWDADVYNAADFGGYTNRERLIVRAVKDGELPEKPKKQPRKGGWLEAVEDILPTLTVKESGVAPWMDARLKADGIDWQKVEKPLYVMGSAYADGKIPHAYGDEILPTLRTKSGDVIIMPGGKVLRADGRVLARITGLGDDYLLPKTESLAHTIIGNGIPVQLTQSVIAPLLNKDDLSGRNVLARLGKSIFKNDWDVDKQKKVSDQVVNTANKLGGAEATVYTSVDEVPDAYLSEVKNGATGWYDPETHTVHVYLPNCADASEAERTVLHEKIGHEGMEVLLGGEDEVRKFANFVYNSVAASTRGKILEIANEYDPDWKNPDRMNIGTQEYIAHLAEEGPKTAEDFTLWTKIKHYLIRFLKKLGIRVPGLLNDKDLRYYLMKAGKALHVWDNMPKEKQEAMMKQANNAEIKDALSDGAGKGKPRQKKGESTIQYMKRVQEWRKWQNAREDENDPEPPMFYDIDKDEAGKKEWAQLNKDWRERHHLAGEEPMGMPIRMEGEEDGAYMTRIHEYEKWKEAMKDQEDPMPDMFAYEKKKQEEVKRKYEDWLARHELLEQQQADLDLYEGKIYPAETNPKADALEQQVMQDLAEVTSTDVSKEGASKTVKHAVIHRRKNMEEASADDAIYINDVKNRIEKMADSGAFDKLLSDYKGKPNRAEKLAEAIPYIIEAPRRLRDLANDLNATGAFDKGHIHIQPADVEAIQPFVADLIAQTGKRHTELKDGKEVEVYDDPQAVGEVASKMAQAINANHQGEEGFVPIDGSDILSEHVLPLVKQQIVPEGIDYKNLSPEMKASIDSIRDWYNYTYDWLKDNHTLREDTGYNADYVNHIWDKEKSDKQAYAMYVENRQRTKSPNEKPRTISTLMEGISVGLVPKTTDITKMMAYYSRSNIEAWVNKTMLQELSGLNVIERNEDGEIISSDPLLSSTPPFNLEQYQYFEIPGVGPVWVYNVSPKQMKVKNPITGKEKVLYSEASAGDRFGVVFETYQSSPFWKAFDTLASSAKKLELGFSGFHAGALTEVYMVQNMVEFGPKKAMANFMKYIFADTAKNHELPCFANPQDFQEAATHLVKFGATNDYAAADVQNMFDNLRDSMMKVQEKLKDGNKISGTVALATMPLKVATQMLSLINKGMDRALWDFLHDGLKLATYRMRADKTKERAKKKGWTEEELSRALDEDGQFVNDMFGGQHWDVLGASHRTLRYAGRVLLSPDWNASTTRHFLALTGFGSIWNEATFENFKQYYQRLWHKELMPEDEGRRSRQISALLCYGIGFMVFYEAFANGINAAFRALDEEKERKKAEEIRKTNPSYKSMYELAYGDEGMKWYDYLMRGNSLGQQSKIFLGRYADGTEMYIRHGKQFREVPEYLFNHKGELEFPGPMVQRMIGKANPMVRMTLDDINYLSDFQASHADQEIQRKYGKTIGLLYKDALYWAPFLIPSQENKEFKAVDFFFPSSKGFSPWKAQSYFKDFILSGDMEGVVMTYQSCQRNGIDAEAQIKAAIGSVKALDSAEMNDGVTSLQEASKRFDAAKSITEKKKMRQKMKKFLSQSDYKAFTQKEALDMVQGYLNGDEDLKEMEKAESKYLMKAKAEDVTEDWRIQNVWNGTMETYQEYKRLKDVDKAKANAFKNSKTNKRLFAARKAISAARRKMNKAKKQMDGTNGAAKLVEIRNTRKELLEKLNGME
jgi:site-specific DNA-cytosine methylase